MSLYATRGYWQAFQPLRETVGEVIAGGDPGSLFRAAHRDWYRELFQPCVATGTGKTKIMSLPIVWSYFQALRESDSVMARNFVFIAPNLTVFEGLKEDFGDGRIFDRELSHSTGGMARGFQRDHCASQ